MKKNNDPYNGHDYVEIGGLKWATMNIGATGITDYGLYFQWGDTSGYTGEHVTGSTMPHKEFSWEDYKYTNDNDWTGIYKYQIPDGEFDAIWYNEREIFIGDNKSILELTDDAVRANWGGEWRIPSIEDIASLSASVNTSWTSNYEGSRIPGLICTDKTDSSKKIFFPACGSYDNNAAYNVGSGVECYINSLSDDYTSNANYLRSQGRLEISNDIRTIGKPIRPVIG